MSAAGPVLRPIVTALVFVGVTFLGFFLMSQAMDSPGENRGVLEALMVTGVPGLALVLLVGWPLLLPPLLLAWVLARETWRRMTPEPDPRSAPVPFSGIGSRWGTKWSWQTNLITTLLPLSLVLAWGHILATNAREKLVLDALELTRESSQSSPVSVCRAWAFPFRVGVQLLVHRERSDWAVTYRYLTTPIGTMQTSMEGRIDSKDRHDCSPAFARARA